MKEAAVFMSISTGEEDILKMAAGFQGIAM
jgi:hypothetical protein